MLQFDAELAAELDRIYRGRDFVRRRHANLEALAPRKGERIVDIGCGTGILLGEIAGAVGADGMVTGIEPSGDMRDGALSACVDLGNVAIMEGTAEALPLADGSQDGIVSVQVFEYLEDLSTALAECRRVLAPNGRLVVGDMHFGTLAWHSDDPQRMQRVISAWDGHFKDRAVPATILGLLDAAGFRHRQSIPVTFVDTEQRKDGLAMMMQRLMTSFAVTSGAMEDDEAQAWSDELDALAREGRYFFSCTHVVTVADAV